MGRRPTSGEVYEAVVKAQARKAAGALAKPATAGKPFGLSEKGRQQQSVAAARNLGYLVIETGKVKQAATCAKCSRATKRKVKGECPVCKGDVYEPSYGNDPGVADTLVTFPPRPGAAAAGLWPGWGGVWKMIEMKTSHDTRVSPVRPEQQELTDLGVSVVCINAWEYMRAIAETEAAMPCGVNPRLADWFKINEKAGGWN